MNELNHIWPPYEALYIESLLSIIRGAKREYETFCNEIDSCLRAENFDQDLILDSGLSIVNQSAMMSRYFWPARNNEIHNIRADHLKDVLLVTDASPLKNRDVRNHHEHFDENLDVNNFQILTGVKWHFPINH